MSDIPHISPVGLNFKTLTDIVPQFLPFSGYLTPPQIATAYNMPSSTGAGVKIGIIAPAGGGFLQGDLDYTVADMVANGLLPSGTIAPTINKVLLDGQTGVWTGGESPPLADIENTLDIYCIATLVPAADITIYIGSSFRTTIDRAVSDGCHILSISYSYTTGEPSTITLLLDELSLAAAAEAKIAVCVSSGDSGSAFEDTGGTKHFSPGYPASSPQVIGVGGTKLVLNTNNTRLSETDDNRDVSLGATLGGGGGISGYFSLPSWQSGLTYTPILNNVTGSPTALTMRGVPDISAPMNNYAMRYNGDRWIPAAGTSASAPIMAGMLARLQALSGKRRSSAEYNALFYNHKNSFYDITVGTNNILITDGYAGTSDWDPVTGLGPPMADKVYRYIKNALRPVTGNVSPTHAFDRRPATGMVWPRTKTL
jgi:kumamolisin